MATESALTRPDRSAGADLAPIENEIPTYRAISPPAVGSLFFGVLSLLCYVNPWFLAASVVAIVLGIMAVRKIRQQPDAYTGRFMAQTGIVLALVGSISSITMSSVQSMLISRGASQFAKNEIVSVIEQRDLPSILWWKEAPSRRIGRTPEDVVKQYHNPNAPSPAMAEAMFEMMAGAGAKLVRDLKEEPNAKVRFERIEQTGVHGVTPYAFAVLRIEWPPHEHHEGDEDEHKHDNRGDLIGMLMKSERQGKRELWWIEDYYYPYTPHTYQEKMKPVDDGHGH